MLDAELITHNLCTHGYHLIDDFLDWSMYQQLRHQAEEMHRQGLFKSAKIGLKNQAQRNETIRGDSICWVDEEKADASLQSYFDKTQQLADLLNQSLFLGLNELESHFAIYQPGTFYKKHIDQFATTKDRKISCVYYLNSNWQEDMGGELKLYSQTDELLQSVSPQGNRFICFNSELPHEVSLTHQTRYSITGWMKTRSMSVY